MKHYILLKLVPGTDPVEVQERMWKGLREMDDTLDWVNHPVVRRSCMPGDDYDLMATVEITEEERLSDYRSHSLTAHLEAEMKKVIAAMATFDHY